MAPWRRAKWRQLSEAGGELFEGWRALRGLFMPDEIPPLVGPRLRSADTWASAMNELSAVEDEVRIAPGMDEVPTAVAWFETRFYLASQLLRDIDVMSMAHSLEVRVPLIDHELLAVVWPAVARHPRLLRNKSLLHQTLARRLPDEIVRRPKQGFLLPFHEWMRSDLKDLVDSGMRSLEGDGWIAPGTADRLWTAWQRGEAHWVRPWALGILGHFTREVA
jgi:asparagine synthase (glutamine-hydrolysing)